MIICLVKLLFFFNLQNLLNLQVFIRQFWLNDSAFAVSIRNKFKNDSSNTQIIIIFSVSDLEQMQGIESRRINNAGKIHI